MEHEFEKIRSKVSQAEQNPVSWEKELVWSKIGQPARRNFIFYYAAASLLVASAICFYAYERTNQMKLDLQLKAIELSIEKTKTLQSSIEERQYVPETTVCVEKTDGQEIKKSAAPPHKMNRPKEKGKATPIVTEQLPDEEIINNTVALTESVDVVSETIKPIDELKSPKKVQAIIGNNDAGSASTVKDKKIKFRLFMPEENTETIPAAADAISFHSKIN